MGARGHRRGVPVRHRALPGPASGRRDRALAPGAARGPRLPRLLAHRPRPRPARDRTQRGQGVARAALRTVTGWALRDLGVPRLQLYIEPWNTASARIAEDIGFRREGLLRGWQQVGDERRDMAVYALLNSDVPVDGRAVTAH
ncbi:GNAT family protein [Streptomyces sp. MBT61]|uniref:GNAT family N-acetyltransferase n=1 Tax=Streptomyces sp. MBT61 TaxID=1488392 RepID=UPI0027DCC6F1|nr:GNAT family protein [Streptomyces sp. MBT61]